MLADIGFNFGAYCDCPGTEGFVSVCDGPFCKDGEVFAGADAIADDTDDSRTFTTCCELLTFLQFVVDPKMCFVGYDEWGNPCCRSGGAAGAGVTLAPLTQPRTCDGSGHTLNIALTAVLLAWLLVPSF